MVATDREACPVFSDFSGQTVQTNWPYVTSAIRYLGTSGVCRNIMVLVEFLMRPPTPFAKHPN